MSVGTMMSGTEGEDDWTINEDLGPCHLGSGQPSGSKGQIASPARVFVDQPSAGLLGMARHSADAPHKVVRLPHDGVSRRALRMPL